MMTTPCTSLRWVFFSVSILNLASQKGHECALRHSCLSRCLSKEPCTWSPHLGQLLDNFILKVILCLSRGNQSLSPSVRTKAVKQCNCNAMPPPSAISNCITNMYLRQSSESLWLAMVFGYLVLNWQIPSQTKTSLWVFWWRDQLELLMSFLQRGQESLPERREGSGFTRDCGG